MTSTERNDIYPTLHTPNQWKGNWAWWDDKEALQERCQTLGGLHEVIKARREAIYSGPNGKRDDTVRLQKFVVGGMWHLDEFGQTGHISNVCYEHNEKRPVDMAKLKRTMKVMTEAEFQEWLPDKTSWSRGFGGGMAMPDPRIACACCGKKWTIHDSDTCASNNNWIEISVETPDNIYLGKTLKEVQAMLDEKTDGVYRIGAEKPISNPFWINMEVGDKIGDNEYPRNEHGFCVTDPKEARNGFYPVIDRDTYQIKMGDSVQCVKFTFFHPECKEEQLTEKFLEDCEKAFELANVPIEGKLRVKNGYGSASYRGDWFLFFTGKGMLRIGWRKRVIDCQPMEQAFERGDYGVIKFVPKGECEHLDKIEDLVPYLVKVYMASEEVKALE